MTRTAAWMIVVIVASAVAPVSAQTPVTPAQATNLPAATQTPFVLSDNTVLADTPVSGPSTRFYVGARLIVIAPYFESNPAFLTTTIRSQGLGAPPLTLREQGEFEYDYALSPRIELGMQTASGLGARVRWWHFNQDAQPRTAANDAIPFGSPVIAQTVEGVSPLLSSGPQTGLPAVNSVRLQGAPGGTDTLTFISSLRIDTWDFEATFADLQIERWSFLLAGGARYAQVRQTYGSTLEGAVPQFLFSRQTFDGVGPTIAVEARRPILFPGLAIFGEGRLAMLFGSYEHVIEGRNQGLTPAPFPLQDQVSTVSRQRFLPVIEMEMGAEYARPIGAFEYVLQGAVVSQLWPAGNGAHGYGNMGLFGVAMNMGVRY